MDHTGTLIGKSRASSELNTLESDLLGRIRFEEHFSCVTRL